VQRFDVANRSATPPDPRLPPSEVVRLGEALFFTNAMGPFQKAEGPLSRFTCESCHFEGGIDGRTHRTGRADVVATTKPLFGLGNNAPHFTRALDEDLTEMVFAEFRVASSNTGHSEWFDLDEAGIEWASQGRLALAPHGAADLRRALLLYLASLPHPRNPRTADKGSFTPLERRGQALFAAHCESCHQARLVTNDASTVQRYEQWESLVRSSTAPLVWARDGYEKTEVLPYVHPLGARPSSLRRIAGKTPYFTNGTAVSLSDVLALSWLSDDGTFLHAASTEGGPLFDEAERTALVAFLQLL